MSVIFTMRALQKVKNELRMYPELETGGVLFGMQLGGLWMITDVASSGENSCRGRHNFEMDREHLFREAERIMGTAVFVRALGVWHKHEHNCFPCFSDDDDETNRAFARLHPAGALSVIAAKDNCGYILKAFHVSMTGEYADKLIVGKAVIQKDP